MIPEIVSEIDNTYGTILIWRGVGVVEASAF